MWNDSISRNDSFLRIREAVEGQTTTEGASVECATYREEVGFCYQSLGKSKRFWRKVLYADEHAFDLHSLPEHERQEKRHGFATCQTSEEGKSKSNQKKPKNQQSPSRD